MPDITGRGLGSTVGSGLRLPVNVSISCAASDAARAGAASLRDSEGDARSCFQTKKTRAVHDDATARPSDRDARKPPRRPVFLSPMGRTSYQQY